METLRARLLALDGQGYKSYKALQGTYDFQRFELGIDHVQGDPYARPSRISLRVANRLAAFPAELFSCQIRRIALADYLGRAIKQAIGKYVQGRRGSGCSGEMDIACGGQQVLLRNAVLLPSNSSDVIEARLTLGLPADNRRASVAEAMPMFFEELPNVVDAALYYASLDAAQLERHVSSVEDQQAMRENLQQLGLVAFIADGAVLPRASGVDDRPLAQHALPLQAPHSLSLTMHLPNAGEVRGLAIPCGITLIVGGGFHGKSTLLDALQRGVYNHIPGDGREKVATLASAVKIRAEHGRAIGNVDISPFINNLPFQRSSVEFTTDNASGSTSQAANIIEAISCGSELLLIDEDTSATNFMIRDQRMQALVAKDKEPIVPLVQRVRELYQQLGISVIIVMGGSGDYFDVADRVIMMDTYQPRDVTAQAKALTKPSTIKQAPAAKTFSSHAARRPQQAMLDPRQGARPAKIDVRGIHTLLYGKQEIDLSQVEQLVDSAQTRTIGQMIHYYAENYTGQYRHDGLLAALKKILALARQQGLDCFNPYKAGDLAMPRLYELAAAINRMRDGTWQ